MEIRTGLRPEVTRFAARERSGVARKIETPTEHVDASMTGFFWGVVDVWITTFFDRDRRPISTHVGEREPTIERKVYARMFSSVEVARDPNIWEVMRKRERVPSDARGHMVERSDFGAWEGKAEWFEVTL